VWPLRRFELHLAEIGQRNPVLCTEDFNSHALILLVGIEDYAWSTTPDSPNFK
jgi:hypothetical protein